MNVEHLVSMANQIGRYYEAYPDRAESLLSAATHVRRYWDPRMRTALLHHLDTDGGEGLDPFMLEAVTTHRAALTPKASTPPPKP